MGETRRLAEFVHRTGYADLPPSVVARAKVYVLDCLACGFVGAPHLWAAIVADMVKGFGGSGEVSMFTLDWRAPTPHAALVNGVMIGGFESEHVGHVSHPAGTVFPAALAVAERDHVSGRDFLTALALGYEVVCRIGEAQTGTVETERGFHNPAANGPFSAAVATGKLLGFDVPTLLNALGIAGSHCGGLTEYAWQGEMTKRLHLGRASQLGLESALLAQRGFTGPPTIIEGRYGYLNAFSPTPHPERLLAGLGETWLMETLIIKRYPCHVTSQAIVGAIQALKAAAPIDPAAIERIEIQGSGHMLQRRFLNAEPTSMMGAQYSLIFTTAAAFCRDFDDPLTYDESTLSDPQIGRLARLITVSEAPGAEGHGHGPAHGATLLVTIGGETHQIEAPAFRGSLANPADFADLADKLRRYSRHALDDAQQARLIGLVERLDQLPDVAELARALRGRHAEDR